MKKLLMVLCLLFGFMGGIAYAEPNNSLVAPQDLGQDANTGGVPQNGQGQLGTVKQEMKNVTKSGMASVQQFLDNVVNEVDSKMIINIQRYYQNITSPIIPIFAGAIILWLVWQGMRMMLGTGDPYEKTVFTFIKMVIIWTFVFSWDTFYVYVVEVFLTDIPALISEMTGTDANTTFTSFVTIIFETITSAMGSVSGGISNLVPAFFFSFVYAMMMLCAVILCAIFFTIMIICKFIVGILLAVAPIFVACLMFPATQKYFSNWLGAVITPNLIILMMIITCDLILTAVISGYTAVFSEGSATFVGSFVLLIAMGITGLMFLLVPRLAISLSGSAYEASAGAMNGIASVAKRAMSKGMMK